MKTYSKTDKWVGQIISVFFLGAIFVSFQNMAPPRSKAQGPKDMTNQAGVSATKIASVGDSSSLAPKVDTKSSAGVGLGDATKIGGGNVPKALPIEKQGEQATMKK